MWLAATLEDIKTCSSLMSLSVFGIACQRCKWKQVARNICSMAPSGEFLMVPLFSCILVHGRSVFATCFGGKGCTVYFSEASMRIRRDMDTKK